jgi:hypothetical protein
MITFSKDTRNFSKALQNLAKGVNVSTSKFVKNEARLMSEELAKQFTPKLTKSQKGIETERKMAFRIGKVGLGQIPWSRLQRIINRQRATGQKPTVQASVAMPALRKSIAALGTLAAGFIGRGNKLGVSKVKGFVMGRIAQARGDVTIHMGLLSKWVRIRNFSPWLQNMRGAEFLTRKAIKKRTGAIRTQARLIAKGVKQYWKP